MLRISLLSTLLAAASTTVLVRDDFSTTVLVCESRAVRGVDEQRSCAAAAAVKHTTRTLSGPPRHEGRYRNGRRRGRHSLLLHRPLIGGWRGKE